MAANSSIQENGNFDKFKWFLVLTLVVGAIAANQIFDQIWVLYRFLGVLAVLVSGAVIASQTDKGKQFITFFKESLIEVRKVVWPSRQETTNTTLIVLAVTFVIGLMLWGLDSLLLVVVNFILGI